MTAIDLDFRSALAFWFQLGWISFGGPAGQVAIMHRELVEQRRWISEGRFLHALNYCMVLPGPEAQQLATYIGWLLHGVRGGIAAGVLFVLPSLAILTTLAWTYLQYGSVPVVAAALYGMKAAVVAIVALAIYRLSRRVLKTRPLRFIAIAALMLVAVLKISFPLVILAAAVLGWVIHGLWPNSLAAPSDAGQSGATALDDSTAPIYSRRRLITIAMIGLTLWGLALCVLWAMFGWNGALTQMAWFFSKAALVTFGGAYAVLPYVQEASVDQFQWLTATQFVDGLALGETTPGPLIMIVTYIGFVGAWTHEVFGPNALLTAGVLGALVATFFTFLPSFLFILVGAPLVESTRNNLRVAAPLLAVSAAVVGVMANFGLFLARHVFWIEGQGSSGGVDGYAVAIAAVACLALIRMHLVWVLLGCALLGLGRSALL